MITLLLVVTIFLLAYKFYKFAYHKPPNSPPSIPRIPISGSYLILLLGDYSYPYKTFNYYIKKLKSKIIGFYLGSAWSVVVNDYASIKEVLTRDEFDGRVTDIKVIKERAFGQKLGLFFTDGPFWHEQRRYFLRNIRDFGFGRRQEALEKEILDEVSLLIDILKNGPVHNGEKEVMKGNLLLFPDILHPVICNSLWTVYFGQRFDRSEHDIPRRIGRMSMIFQQSLDSTGGAIFHLPFLRFFGNMFGFKNMMKANYAVTDIIQKYLKSHNDTLDENVERGLVDKYLNILNKDNKSPSFSEKQLIVILTETMLGTCSTIPSFITQIIKYLIHNPRVLKKAQDEIDQIVGTGRLVTWNDRKNLPYMEAVIRETSRISSLLPLSLFHRAVKNTTLGEYTIPANTMIITNISAMHHDPDLWGDPANFRPERFINENGELVKDKSLLFGLGHRVCPGETYSRYFIFGLITALLQSFNFYPVEGEPSRPGDDLPGLVITPKNFWTRYEIR